MCVVWTLSLRRVHGCKCFSKLWQLAFWSHALIRWPHRLSLQSAALMFRSSLNSKMLKLTTDNVGFNYLIFRDMDMIKCVTTGDTVIIWLTFSMEKMRIGDKLKEKKTTESEFLSRQNSFNPPLYSFTKETIPRMWMLHDRNVSLENNGDRSE